MTATATVTARDTDGIAPGVDTSLQGQFKTITFSGHFFARPEIPTMKFSRLVHIVFASKEVYVAYDLQLKNLYVVDRASGISLGCKMNAVLTDYPEGLRF